MKAFTAAESEDTAEEIVSAVYDTTMGSFLAVAMHKLGQCIAAALECDRKSGEYQGVTKLATAWLEDALTAEIANALTYMTETWPKVKDQQQ